MGRACSKFAHITNDVDTGGLLPRDGSDGVRTSENTPVAMGGVGINISEEGVVVIVRIRPKSSKEQDEKTCLRVQGPMQLDIIGTEQPPATKIFNFDAVLPEVTTQDQVFRIAGPKLIENALKGFNTTMVAYGQTGSGKTFTMEGSKRDPGMIPRLCKGLFEAIGASESADKTSVSASYIEIYLESIRDLLDPNGTLAGAGSKLSPRSGSCINGGSFNSVPPVAEGRCRSPCRSQIPMNIRENKDGVFIENVTMIKVDSEAAVLALLTKGSKARSVGETQMNSASSRSHAVLTLSITQTSVEEGGTSTITSKISLVDLAGSERAKSTGAAGQRLKEGVQINKSLSALGNVIKALTSGSTTHVPYRDSKLTRLLQDSLGGTAYTVVCCNVSPIEASEPETLSTLRFAERLKKVKNKMVVHMDAKSKELKALKRENAELRAKVEELERMLDGGVQTMGYTTGRGIRSTA